MAFTASTVWEVQTGGSDSNGGGFDTGVSGFPTDGAATSATGTAPVFTSASYNFVAGDVGAWIYIKSGTNWTPGWYKIASVAANAATLNATIGQAVLAAGTPTTVAGCATTASPTGATWGIDYSQGTAAIISFTDMVIDGTTNTKFTSAAFPVGKNFVGNVINVTSGTGFTVQRVAVVSTSGTVATCDKSLGTLSSTGGNGAMGGCLLGIGILGSVIVASNQAHLKSGAYSISTASTNVTGGCYSVSTSNVLVMGYNTVRGDFGTPPVFTASGSISTFTIFATTGNDGEYANLTVDGSSYTSSKGFNLGRSLAHKLKASNCTNNGISNTNGVCLLCQAIGCASVVAIDCPNVILCEAYSNTISGFQVSRAIYCLSYANSGASSDGFQNNSTAGVLLGCVSYNNGRDGFRGTVGSGGHSLSIINCIAEGNTGIGFNRGSNTYLALLNCATFNNTGGASSTGSDAVVLNNVTLSASPFVNAAGGNFALNNTASAGASCRAAGIPGTFPSGTTVGYLDIGAAQHADPTLGFQIGIYDALVKL